MIRQFEFELEKAEHGMAHPITPSASSSCAGMLRDKTGAILRSHGRR